MLRRPASARVGVNARGRSHLGDHAWPAPALGPTAAAPPRARWRLGPPAAAPRRRLDPSLLDNVDPQGGGPSSGSYYGYTEPYPPPGADNSGSPSGSDTYAGGVSSADATGPLRSWAAERGGSPAGAPAGQWGAEDAAGPAAGDAANTWAARQGAPPNAPAPPVAPQPGGGGSARWAAVLDNGDGAASRSAAADSSGGGRWGAQPGDNGPQGLGPRAERDAQAQAQQQAVQGDAAADVDAWREGGAATAAAASRRGPAAEPPPPSQQGQQRPPRQQGAALGGAPGAPQQPAFEAPDWGEVVVSTDWGGAVASVDGAGWDEDGPLPYESFDPDANAAAAAAAAAASSSGRQRGRRGGAADAPDAGGAWPQADEPYDGWDGVRFAQDAQYDGRGDAGPAYDSGGGPWRSDAGGGGGAAGPGGGAADWAASALRPSDIVLLSGREASSVLPLTPTAAQLEFFQPRTLPERIVQYTATLGASVALSKVALLAGPALLYPLWAPWLRAGLRNLDAAAAPYAAVGLWRAQVLDVAINGLSVGGLIITNNQPPTVSLLVGDPWPGGARAALDMPYVPRADTVQRGDAVELLVLGRDGGFGSFKVVRELYLPQSNLWLAEYPFLNRELFTSVSIAIERARMAAAAEQQQQWQQQQQQQAGGEMYDGGWPLGGVDGGGGGGRVYDATADGGPEGGGGLGSAGPSLAR